jgi:hypothetical protein
VRSHDHAHPDEPEHPDHPGTPDHPERPEHDTGHAEGAAADASEDAGLLMLALLLAAYAVAETIGGYGFLAVFVGGVAARQYHREHELHARAHQFMDQIERLAMVVGLLGFGALLATCWTRTIGTTRGCRWGERWGVRWGVQQFPYRTGA